VVDIRRNGAVLKVREDSEDKVFVPGWKRQLSNSSGTWLSTLSGECIGLGDLVAYYVDLQDIRPGYTAVGKNVMVLKESQEVKKQDVRRRRQSTERSEGAKYGVDTTGDEAGSKRSAGSDSDTESEGGVSDGELEWLEKDIGTIIAKEDPQAKTLKLLAGVQSQLREVRGKKGGLKKKGIVKVKSFRAGYTPMGNNEDSFWRMRKLLASMDAGYNSEDDPDYEPGDEVEQVRKPRMMSENMADTSFTSGVASSEPGKKGTKRNRLDSTTSCGSVGKRSDRVRAESRGRKLPYWVRAVSLPEVFDPELGKFVAVDKAYYEAKDPDYELPETDVEIVESEEEDEELEKLVKEALEELPDELRNGKHKSGKVVSPVKVTLTPVKDGEEQEEEILTLDSEEDESTQKPLEMWAKELLLKEQSEEYDSEEDPEYVPPSIIYETDKEYDEYSDGGDAIPKEEVEILLKEVKKPLEPPSSYIPIWVPVPSPAEKIARAKEQVEINKEESKSETSGKDTDSNGKKSEENSKEVEAKYKGKKVVEGETMKVGNKKVATLETGLTPMMKKLNVEDEVKEVEINDQSKKVKEGESGQVDEKELSKNKPLKCEESNDVPKPKRERKKSKSKGGDGDGADQASADVAKEEDAVPVVTSTGDAVNAEKGEDGKSTASRNPNVAEVAEKSPVKTDMEKGKKSPSKKSGKVGQEKTG